MSGAIFLLYQDSCWVQWYPPDNLVRLLPSPLFPLGRPGAPNALCQETTRHDVLVTPWPGLMPGTWVHLDGCALAELFLLDAVKGGVAEGMQVKGGYPRQAYR